jgi:hypothetical protein
MAGLEHDLIRPVPVAEGRFATHESWINRSAYDANEKAPQMAALRDGLKPLAGAPLDRRTYRPLSIGPPRNAGSDGAVYMVLFLDVFPRSTIQPRKGC